LCGGRSVVDRAMVSPRPSSIALAVGVAAGYAEVLRAEALARELLARLAPFGAPAFTGCVWRLRGDAMTLAAAPDYPFDGAWWETPCAVVATRARLSRARKEWHGTVPWLGYLASYAAAWRDAAQAGERVPSGGATAPAVRRALQGRRLAHLPDPFDPLSELCQGPVLYERTDAATGQVWLTLPEY
jgi:hypothetical protein